MGPLFAAENAPFGRPQKFSFISSNFLKTSRLSPAYHLPVIFKNEKRNFIRREKTKDAHKHNQKRILAALLTTLLSAAVSAAPILVTDSTHLTQAAAAALETSDVTNSLTSELDQAVATLGTVLEGKPTLTLSIPGGPWQDTSSAATGWKDGLDDLISSGSSSLLGHTLFRIRFPKRPGWGHAGRPVPAVTVPAPGSILLGSIGLLLVRALRERRIIQ